MPKFNTSLFIRVFLIAAFLTAALLALLAAFLYFVKPNDSQISFLLHLIYIIPCFVSGFIIGKQSSSRKFLWGLLFGITYFAVIILLSLIEGIAADGKAIAITAACCLLSGMFGGILS